MCGAGGGVLVGKRVVAMRSPSARRYWMTSACSIILFLVCILCERVVDVIVKGLCCKSETSLSGFCWSSAVFNIVASRISSDHCARRGYGIGNWDLMDLGWSISLVGFIAGCEDGWINGMCMVVLTPLWYKRRVTWCVYI